MLKTWKARRTQRLAAFNQNLLRNNATTITALAEEIRNLPAGSPATELAEQLENQATEAALRARVIDRLHDEAAALTTA